MREGYHFSKMERMQVYDTNQRDASSGIFEAKSLAKIIYWNIIYAINLFHYAEIMTEAESVSEVEPKKLKLKFEMQTFISILVFVF